MCIRDRVIFSTHDRQEALWLSDQIIRLDGPPLTIVEVFSEKDEFPLEKGDALESVSYTHLAALALYLASPAAAYLTGQVFGVNGGLVI